MAKMYIYEQIFMDLFSNTLHKIAFHINFRCLIRVDSEKRKKKETCISNWYNLIRFISRSCYWFLYAKKTDNVVNVNVIWDIWVTGDSITFLRKSLQRWLFKLIEYYMMNHLLLHMSCKIIINIIHTQKNSFSLKFLTS